VVVVVEVVCAMTCSAAIKQKTAVAIAIRFIAGLPLDRLAVIFRPIRALGAIASAAGPGRLQIRPGTTLRP
jgi:hypothetical protein